MMNGRPAWAVRTLMGAAELYITLLSVCERLLKALKSQLSDTGPRADAKLPQAGDGVSGVPSVDTKVRRWWEGLAQVRMCPARGEEGTTLT